MIFSNPQYLWGLLGLLVPLAIHLWSNKKGKIIKIGSIVHLQETDASQTNSIQLNELLLLTLRMLILGLIVVLMAQPKITTVSKKNANLTYVVERSLLKDKDIVSNLNDLPEETEIRVFEKGLPEILIDDLDTEAGITTTIPKYWQLASELEALRSDSIVVYTKGLQKGLYGKRPTINKPINWIVLSSDDDGEVSISIENDYNGNDIELLFENNNISISSEFNNDGNNLNSDTNNKIESTTRSYKVAIQEGDSLKDQINYIETAFNSISKFINFPIQIEKNLDSDRFKDFGPDLYVDLRRDYNVDSTLKTINYNPEYTGSDLLIEKVKGKHYVLTKPLNAELIIEEHLLETLVGIMNIYPVINRKIDSLDTRTVSTYELEPNIVITEEGSGIDRSIGFSGWLALVLGLLMISERFVSKARNQ